MKEEIIKAAATRFARYGYQKTTLGDIASDLNKVKSSVYYYFDTKEALFKEVIISELETFAVMIRESLKTVKNPSEKLHTFITSHLQVFEKITMGYSFLKDMYFSKHDIVRKTRKVYDEREKTLIENIIDEGIKTKEFGVKDKKIAAFSVLIAIKGAEQEFAAEKSIKDIKAVSETLADIIVNGISKEKSK